MRSNSLIFTTVFHRILDFKRSCISMRLFSFPFFINSVVWTTEKLSSFFPGNTYTPFSPVMQVSCFLTCFYYSRCFCFSPASITVQNLIPSGYQGRKECRVKWYKSVVVSMFSEARRASIWIALGYNLGKRLEKSPSTPKGLNVCCALREVQPLRGCIKFQFHWGHRFHRRLFLLKPFPLPIYLNLIAVWYKQKEIRCGLTL